MVVRYTQIVEFGTREYLLERLKELTFKYYTRSYRFTYRKLSFFLILE